MDAEAEGSFGLAAGAARLWNQAVEELRTYLLAGVRSVAALMAGVVVLGAAETMAPGKGELVSRCGTAVGALWITAVSAGDLHSLIGLGQSTITEVSQLSRRCCRPWRRPPPPGRRYSGSYGRWRAVFFSNALLYVMEGVLLPMVYLYIGVAAAGAVLEGEVLSGIARLMKKVITWSLSGLLLLFTTYLTVSGAVAGTADAAAVKAAKAAMSGAVPVVGGHPGGRGGERAGRGRHPAGDDRRVRHAGGAGALPDAVSAAGSAISALSGGGPGGGGGRAEETHGLIARLGDAFGLVLAMTAATALLLLISLVSSLTAVTA